jgi:hypothetical protein
MSACTVRKLPILSSSRTRADRIAHAARPEMGARQRNQVPEKVRPWLNVNTDYRMREHIVVQPREQNLECRARQQRILH